MRNKKGVTLLELIIALALVGLVINIAASSILFGNKVHKKSIDEYEIQASTRLIAETVNRVARFSTATFTIPRSSFRPDNLTNYWNYVGVLEQEYITSNGETALPGSIILFEYDNRNGVEKHYSKILAKATDKVRYEITFKKAEKDHSEKILSFAIQGFIEGRPVEYDENNNKIGHINIFSQTESLNSLQIIHKGTNSDPAVAIAFRTDDRNDPQRPIAHIAMVLDRSGSMNDKMDGSETNTNSQRRITHLKNSLRSLVNKFSNSKYPTYISLIPFSTSANTFSIYNHEFYDVTDTSAHGGKATIDNAINELSAEGATNTGDGMRRAYYKLVDSRNSTENIQDYMIILVDGVTTVGARIEYGTRPPSNPSKSSAFFTQRGNIKEGTLTSWNGTQFYYNGNVHGHGAILDTAHGEPYVSAIGDLIKAYKDEAGNQKIKVFVIGFSSKQSDFGSLNTIANAAGALPIQGSSNRFYTAGDEAALIAVFDKIQGVIMEDLFHIDGPDL